MDYPPLNLSLSRRLAHISGLRCVICGQVYMLDEVMYTCHACGEVGTLDVEYHLYQKHDSQSVPHTPTARLTMWQRHELLPLAEAPPAGLQLLGGTPLIPYTTLQHLASACDVGAMCIKNDGLNLTGSLKDRASAMVIAHALLNLDRKVIATASTGNAAAALAGVCAAVEGAQAVIFVPASAPQGKIAQMLVFGAKVLLVDGDYDTAFDLCRVACAEFGWYNRSTGINPFTTEGKKTVIFEIASQLQGQMPDVIVVSVGDGSIIGGVHKGLVELYRNGWIDQMPRLIGVQSAGSDALVYAWENHLPPEKMTPRPAQTIADSISSGLPRDRAKALRAIRDTHGAFVRVSDVEILAAIPALARASGVFAEPAAAAVFAALRPARQANLIRADDRILLLITGNGLKDVQGAMQAIASEKPPVVEPHLQAVEKHVKTWE